MKVRALALALVVACPPVVTGQEAKKVLIRAQYRLGDRLDYRWQIDNDTRWAPPVKGGDWLKMQTDFDFTLVAAHLEADGGCTFDLVGNDLESVAQGAKGKLGVRATPEQASLLLGQKWLKPGPMTPLSGPMTVTLGPRFEVAASTGLEPLGLYFLPGVSFQLWAALTSAPVEALEPGHQWKLDFDVPIPGVSGEPLHAGATFESLGVQRFGDRNVLKVRLTARLTAQDVLLTLKKGERVHITQGEYVLRGVARWDTETGMLLLAEAEQSFHATADRPPSQLSSTASSTLTLLER